MRLTLPRCRRGTDRAPVPSRRWPRDIPYSPATDGSGHAPKDCVARRSRRVDRRARLPTYRRQERLRVSPLRFRDRVANSAVSDIPRPQRPGEVGHAQQASHEAGWDEQDRRGVIAAAKVLMRRPRDLSRGRLAFDTPRLRKRGWRRWRPASQGTAIEKVSFDAAGFAKKSQAGPRDRECVPPISSTTGCTRTSCRFRDTTRGRHSDLRLA